MKAISAIFCIALAAGFAMSSVDMALAQTPGPTLVGSIAGSWRIKALRNESGRLVRLSARSSAEAAIDIQPEGRWSAYLGCNRMSGRLFQRGEKIEVDDTIISTKMSCAGEAGDLELQFLATFTEAKRITRRDDQATVFDRFGRKLMALTRR